MAAYTFRSVGTFASSAVGGALSPGIPAGTTSGDLMILFATQRSSSQTVSVTDWTELASQTTSGSIKVFAKIAGASESPPSVDWDGSTYAGARIASFYGDVWSGGLATIQDATATTDTGSSTSFDYPSITPGNNDSLVIIFGRHSKTATGDGISVDAEAGFTEIGENAENGFSSIMVWNYVQQTTAQASGAGVWDFTGTAESLAWNSVTIALKTTESFIFSETLRPNAVSLTNLTGDYTDIDDADLESPDANWLTAI